MNGEPNPSIDWQERKRLALQIAALLPPDREAMHSILGLVEDVFDWAHGRPSQATKPN